MRNLILILFIALAVNAKSQNNIDSNYIYGIGVIKIGTHKDSIIGYFENKHNTKTVNIYDAMSELKKCRSYTPGKCKICKYNLNIDSVTSLLMLPYRTKYCENTDFYYISEYEISGITIRDIFLTFYDGYLYEIENDPPNKDLVELIKFKYGNPKTSVETKKIKCQMNLTGNVVEYEEITHINMWQNNHIVTGYITGNYYDDKCKNKVSSSFYITNSKLRDIVNLCEKEAKMSFEKKKQESKFKNISEF